jgi:hypothetical protein
LRKTRSSITLVAVASWLQQEHDERSPDALDWWRPDEIVARLGAAVDWASLSYIVVDELEQEIAGLVVSPWPQVDPSGRLHFGREEDSFHVTVDEERLGALLARRREPIVKDHLPDATMDALRQRKLAIGDVFAARIAETHFRRSPVDPPRLIRGARVLDITAIARAVAKGQTAAALAGLLDPGEEQS